MRTVLGVFAIVLAPALLLSCSGDPVAPTWEEGIAPVHLPNETYTHLRLEDGTVRVVEIPFVEIAASGRQVTLILATFGEGACAGNPRTEVELSGMEARVTPYLLRAPPGSDCERTTGTFRHSAIIEFPEAGNASVTVRGLDGLGPSARLMEIRRTVEVH